MKENIEEVKKMVPGCYYDGRWNGQHQILYEVDEKVGKIQLGFSYDSEDEAWIRAKRLISEANKFKINKGNFLEFKIYGLQDFKKRCKVKAVTPKAVLLHCITDDRSYWIPRNCITLLAKTHVRTGFYTGLSADVTSFHIAELNTWAIENIILKEA